MCYSAEASFAASGVLAVNSLAISRLPMEKASIPLALIPAIFATHQFFEGLVWLNQDGFLPEVYKWGAVYAYVFIAFVLWPIFVPFSAFLAERSRKRRIIMVICQVIGLWVGFTLLLSIVRHPVTVSADCCSISYLVNANELLIAPYLIAVSVPFLASSRRSLVLLGMGIAVSCAAAYYMTTATALPSLWCFFAAILSGGLYLHLRADARTYVKQPNMGDNMEAVAH